MTYKDTKTGEEFVLALHAPADWGVAFEARLVALGLPAEKAKAAVAKYDRAERV